MNKSNDIQVLLNNIPSSVQHTELNENGKSLSHNIRRSYLLISYSSWCHFLLHRRSNPWAPDTSHQSTPGVLGSRWIFWTCQTTHWRFLLSWEYRVYSKKKKKKKKSNIKIDVLISKTLVFWTVSISSKFWELKFHIKSIPMHVALTHLCVHWLHQHLLRPVHLHSLHLLKFVSSPENPHKKMEFYIVYSMCVFFLLSS